MTYLTLIPTVLCKYINKKGMVLVYTEVGRGNHAFISIGNNTFRWYVRWRRQMRSRIYQNRDAVLV